MCQSYWCEPPTRNKRLGRCQQALSTRICIQPARVFAGDETMPSLVVSVGSADERPVALTKERTTLGRRPYNDIVIDHLAVSGEHAVIEMQGQQVYLEDLHSTNGTHVNSKAITRQLLQHNDTIEIGKSKIKYLHAQEFSDTGFDKAMLMQAPLAESAPQSYGGGATQNPAPPQRTQWFDQSDLWRRRRPRDAFGQSYLPP